MKFNLLIQLVFKSTSKKITNDNYEHYGEQTRKGSFFRNIMFWKKSAMKKSDDNIGSTFIYESNSESSCIKSQDELCPSYSYEEIISGKAPLNQLEIERIEVI